MSRRHRGLAQLLPAVLCVLLFCAGGCRHRQRDAPGLTSSGIERTLPPDCLTALHTYIDSQQKRVYPERAVAEFHRLALRYPYEKDSAVHALMKCYEGQVWDVLRRSDSTLACYDEAAPYLEAHPELIDLRAMSYLFSGWAHYYKNNRLTANYYFDKAGNELEDTVYLDDGKEIITSNYQPAARLALLIEIAENAQAAGLKEQARHYAERALHTARMPGVDMPDLQAFALIEAGLIYTRAHEADSGAACFAAAVPILAQLQDTALLIAYHDHKGAAFLFTHRYDSSVASYRNSLRLQELSGAEPLDKAQTAGELAAGYLALGRTTEAQDAITLARPALYDDTTTPLTDRLAFSRTYLHSLLHGTASAPVFERFVAQSDSVFDRQRLDAISDMDAQYGLKKKEARIGRLNKENKTFASRVAAQQTLLLGAGLVITLLVIAGAFLRQIQRRKRLETERDKAVLEQQLLRSQMEPHFIFNTIAVLQSLVRKNERELSVKYLSQFARLLRISLESAREALVPLSDELEALEHYLSLQQVRFRDVFTYAIDTYDGYEEEAGHLMIPPMLLQPFVENAIQHGMAGMKDNAGHIRIGIRKEAAALRCTVEDNGSGEAPPMQKDPAKKNSLSTTITRERLALLSRQSGTPASLDVARRTPDAGGGMLVTLIIPFQL